MTTIHCINCNSYCHTPAFCPYPVTDALVYSLLAEYFTVSTSMLRDVRRSVKDLPVLSHRLGTVKSQYKFWWNWHWQRNKSIWWFIVGLTIMSLIWSLNS